MSEGTPSLSDMAAVMGNGDMGCNGMFAVLLVILLLMRGNGWGGDGNAATTADVQRATDFQALERQNNEGVAATRQVGYDLQTAVKDASYNQLGELHSVERQMQAGFQANAVAHQDIARAVDQSKYDQALGNANLGRQISEGFMGISSKIDQLELSNSQRENANLRQALSEAQLRNATQNLVSWPNAMTWNAGTGPFCNCGCGSYNV